MARNKPARKPAPPATIRTHLELAPELYGRLVDRAKAEERSVAATLRYLIRVHLGDVPGVRIQHVAGDDNGRAE